MGGLHPAVVAIGTAGRGGLGCQVDAGDYRCLPRRRSAVACGRIFGGRVPCHRRRVATGRRDEARYYFTDLLGDAGRVGPIATSFNQSWRGAISRILGHDAGFGPLVLAAIASTAVLAILAWRALDRSDRLGKLLVVELFGLLLSPISWTHHWVWLVPLMIWLIDGPARERPGARILGWGWLVLTIVGVPWLLSFAQPSIWQIGRPWYLAWAGLVYVVATLATLGWIAASERYVRIRPRRMAN